MTWMLGLRRPLGLPLAQIRTHMSRAAKKVAEEESVKAASSNGAELGSQTQQLRKTKIAQSLFPKFMKNYAAKINNAPFSHVMSFLVVHELSAVVPLFALWGAFHYFDYAPIGVPDVVIEEGSKFIRRMAERNDWGFVLHAEQGSRIILQGAAAYFIVKAALPLRLIFSLWAMPWFARVAIIPINSRIANISKRLFKKNK